MNARKPSEMTQGEFVETFGSIYEDSPWVAEEAWRAGIDASHDDIDGLAAHLAQTMLGADQITQLELILAHPELAPPKEARDRIGEHSRGEQKGAGLWEMAEADRQRIADLNRRYREHFGFPFVIAVTGLNAEQVLEAMERRLDNHLDDEFKVALREINRIARIRLQAWWKTRQ